MRDTEYFRQVPKYTVEPKALINHLRSVNCVTENCTNPLTLENVEGICKQKANIVEEDCDKILSACNAHCLPVSRRCTTETVEGVPCFAFYKEFNKLELAT